MPETLSRHLRMHGALGRRTFFIRACAWKREARRSNSALPIERIDRKIPVEARLADNGINAASREHTLRSVLEI
jgi:hypothetical protein